jgi:hypothetical protein
MGRARSPLADRPTSATGARGTGHQAFEVKIVCGPAYPMVEPLVWPTAMDLPVTALGWTEWHLLLNGALCLLQDNTSWDPSALAAELVPKISGWYIEYHLKSAGYIRRMTEYGIATDDSLDALLNTIGETEEPDGKEENEENEDEEGDEVA